MKPRLKSSRAVRELIMAHEPFHDTATRRGRRFVVGFGHTAGAREGVTVTRQDAELLLFYDVLKAEEAVNAAVGEAVPAGVRDALVSFATSIGPAAFKVSDVARLARNNRHREAVSALETWVRAEQDGRLVVSDELVKRRAAEKEMYLKGLEAPASPASELPVASGANLSRTDPSMHHEDDDAPRLGPLVEVDIEFEEPAEAAEEQAPTRSIQSPDPDVDHVARTSIESARRPEPHVAPPQVMPEPDLAEDNSVATREMEPEALQTPSDQTPSVDDDQHDTPQAVEAEPEVEPESVAESESEAEPVMPVIDRDAQAALVKSVVARVSEQMQNRPTLETGKRENLLEPAASEDESQTKEPQLGYSYLKPEISEADSAVALSPQDVPVESEASDSETPALELRQDAVALRVTNPVSVAVTMPTDDKEASAEPTSVEAAEEESVSEPESPAPTSPEKTSDIQIKDRFAETLAEQLGTSSDGIKAPARTEGMSGEAAGAGPFKDPVDTYAGEEDELNPHHVAGRETAVLNHTEPPVENAAGGGRWIYLASLVIGTGLTGVGIWDMLNQRALEVAQESLPFWLVSIAMGLVLSLASIWFFFSSGQRQKTKNGPKPKKDMTGVSGEA